MNSFLTESAEGVSLSIVVQPRAGRTEVQGELGGALKIRLAAPPVDGAANEELIEFLARVLGVKRADVTVRSGLSSKRKVVAIRGITARHARKELCGD